MSSYYSIDSRRVSHREYWWGNRSPLVLFGWLLKWLRIPIPSSTDDPAIESTYPFIVERLPDEIMVQLQHALTALQELGFSDPVYHLIQDPAISTTIYWATMRNPASGHLARVHLRVWQQAKVADRGVAVHFITWFRDGTFAVSSSAKPDMAAPDTVEMLRCHRLPASKLWEQHLQLVSRQRKEIYSVGSRQDTLYAIERLHILLRDFHLARGVFRPRNTDEQASAQAFQARVAEAALTGSQHPEVLAELERLQTDKPGWGNSVIILVISVAVFIALGVANWDWKFTLYLIPLLFIHEAGHWIAMKAFGYRNLRMFFIPLFGAAVTGKHWNVPGWKKALVFLAGPVPGILMGCAFTLAGLITKNNVLFELAIIALLLNGLNLLPFLPMDGGRVLEALLFCRHRYLSVAFQLLAIIGLTLMVFAGLGKVLIGLVVLMALGLPVAARMAKITDKLRTAGLPPPLPGEDRIPQQTAEVIISAVKAGLPPKTSNKTIAQHALNVFESLNARPPGILATLGLLAVHGGSVVLVVLCGLLLIFEKHGGGLGNFLDQVITQPQHEYACNNEKTWSGSGFDPEQAHNTIITTLPRRKAAERAFADLSPKLPASSTLTLAGDSLFLSLPAADDSAREKWFDAFQEHSTNTFVSLSNSSVAVSLMCIAPTKRAATNIVQELNEYLSLTYFPDLVAPWSSELTPALWEKHKAARRTWADITRQAVLWTNAELTAIGRRIASAEKRGSVAEVQRLEKEQDEKRQELQNAIFKRLKHEGTSPELVDLYAQWSSPEMTNRQARLELMEVISEHLGRTSSDKAQASATSGYVVSKGLFINLKWLSFKHPAQGLPAITGWLCSKDCRDLKYDIFPPTEDIDGDDE